MMKITDKILLENGYREWETNKMFHPQSKRFFQKRFRNKKGQTKYFISFYEYGAVHPMNYEVELQFQKDKYTMNITLFAIRGDMTLEEIEQEVYKIWYGLDCKYYDCEEE